MTDWNSTLYLKFERERARAARDLIAHIPDFNPGGAFDLGCGPGNSTELLTARFPDASVVGIDLSERCSTWRARGFRRRHSSRTTSQHGGPGSLQG